MTPRKTSGKSPENIQDISRKKEELRSYLREKGFKSTRQRDIIAHEFLKAGEHVTSEELYNRVSKKHSEIGHTTVYRTLKLLKRSGLATERVFADNLTRYEPIAPDDHHDHLICLACGSITEFKDRKMERLQQKIAEGFGFCMTSHKMEIYGYCKDCGPSAKRR